MEDEPTPVPLSIAEPLGRGPRPGRRWLTERRRSGERDASFGFAARLFGTVLLTLALVGTAAYVLLDRNLAQRQISDYAAAQLATARAFEAVGSEAANPTQAIHQIDVVLDSVGKRAGTVEAVLIDQHRVVKAELQFAHVGETVGTDPRIDAALQHGKSFAGRDNTLGEDHRNFQFVIPINLPNGRYAYEVTYDHRTYDAQVSEVRTILALIGIFGLIGGGVVFYVVGGRRLMRAYRMVLRRATRDGLTDLPNHRAFQDEFSRAVASAVRHEEPLAVALIDVDDFKLTNDRYGHPHGDGVLTRVAAILSEARPSDRPYRMGGDEFALLLAHTDADGARVLTRRLHRKLADAGISVSVGVSALRPGLQADSLRSQAEAAAYEARRLGGNGCVHFDDLGEHLAVTTAEKKEAVRRLIEEGRLTTEFQPIWDIGAATLVGVESLARPDPSYGLSGPAEAFDVAELIGRVRQLDVLCVESALRFAPELEPDVLLFINLSPSTLDLDAGGDDWLRTAVEQAGLAPERVVIEVTERFGGRTESVVRCLRRLRQQGFKIALDDVGTGNSGLEMLRKIEAEFVKIDRSIVVAAATEPGARAVLMAMATFARQTGAFVIAEGVEDEDTLRFLHTIDDRTLESDPIIQGGQGYGLGRPSPRITSQPPEILRSAHALV